MLFPARLWVTHQGQAHFFTTPESVLTWLDSVQRTLRSFASLPHTSVSSFTIFFVFPCLGVLYCFKWRFGVLLIPQCRLPSPTYWALQIWSTVTYLLRGVPLLNSLSNFCYRFLIEVHCMIVVTVPVIEDHFWDEACSMFLNRAGGLIFFPYG